MGKTFFKGHNVRSLSGSIRSGYTNQLEDVGYIHFIGSKYVLAVGCRVVSLVRQTQPRLCNVGHVRARRPEIGSDPEVKQGAATLGCFHANVFRNLLLVRESGNRVQFRLDRSMACCIDPGYVHASCIQVADQLVHSLRRLVYSSLLGKLLLGLPRALLQHVEGAPARAI